MHGPKTANWPTGTSCNSPGLYPQGTDEGVKTAVLKNPLWEGDRGTTHTHAHFLFNK